MVENLLRFAAWQNPLLLPLALLGAAATWRARGPLRSLSAGLALTLLAVTVLMPIQNHGWGYRYLHGLLGNACLLATHGWLRLTDGLTASDRRAARSSLAAMSTLAVLLLSFRVWQVERTVRPYARASAAIAASPADVVLVDGAAFQFGVDLVRNDPFLDDGGPKVLDLQALEAAQIGSLCQHHHVALFGRAVGAPLGLPIIPPAAAASFTALNTADVPCIVKSGATITIGHSSATTSAH